jgi:hypothetical protein
MTCALCLDVRWVCEEHPDKPMGHDGCRGAGDPCPTCNVNQPPGLPPDFENDLEWLPENVAAERAKNGVAPRTASCVGAPWSKQDEYDLRHLLEWEGRSDLEIARFLQREPNEISERIAVATRHGGWRPLPGDDKVISLTERAARKRWR